MTLVKWNRPTQKSLINSGFFNPGVSTLFNHFLDDHLDQGSISYSPAVNISESEDGFNVEFSVPGYDKKSLNIECKNGILTVSGSQKNETDSKTDKFSVREFRLGSFSRSFNIPEDINIEMLSANYENGILKILLPKSKKTKETEIIKTVKIS